MALRDEHPARVRDERTRMEPRPVTRQYRSPAGAARPALPRPSERVIRAERRVERARREQRRLAYLRRRRRLRYDDVVVVEEAALRRAIFGSVVGNIILLMEL